MTAKAYWAAWWAARSRPKRRVRRVATKPPPLDVTNFIAREPTVEAIGVPRWLWLEIAAEEA